MGNVAHGLEGEALDSLIFDVQDLASSDLLGPDQPALRPEQLPGSCHTSSPRTFIHSFFELVLPSLYTSNLIFPISLIEPARSGNLGRGIYL